MAFESIPTREWKNGNDESSGTLALGSHFDAEFNRLYGNDNYLKTEIDKLEGAELDTDVNLAANSNERVPSQKAIKKYVDSHLPIGTILMYDGSGWEDDVTISGWYACVSSNASHGCPDLVDRFIKACDKNYKVQRWDPGLHSFSGRTSSRKGGGNHHILQLDELPKHKHYMKHDHGVNQSSVDLRHRHQVYGGAGTDDWGRFEETAGAQTTRYTNYQLGSHGHGISVKNCDETYTGQIGNNKGFMTQPSYYSVIFIRRCY